MDYITRIYKRKNRHFLIMSASSIHSGLKCLVLKVHDINWQIVHSRCIHYPKKITDIIHEIFYNFSEKSFTLNSFAQLENYMSVFLVESAQTVLSHIPKLKRSMDIIILKKFLLWKGIVEKTDHLRYWNIQLSDAELLARTIKTPVLTDFIRQSLIDKEKCNFPIFYGDINITKKSSNIIVYINIGLISHITIVDSRQSKIVYDSDIGPGTCLIDLAAQEAGCRHGLDRDGATAASGSVNTNSLEILISDELFKHTPPEHTDFSIYKKFLNHKCLSEISPTDKLSTITAFTALIINNFYKKLNQSFKNPKYLWLSGGGTNNLALIDFLTAYFSPIQIKYIEELGIPNNNKLLLSLGLSVQAYLNQKQFSVPGINDSATKHLGKWVLP